MPPWPIRPGSRRGLRSRRQDHVGPRTRVAGPAASSRPCSASTAWRWKPGPRGAARCVSRVRRPVRSPSSRRAVLARELREQSCAPSPGSDCDRRLAHLPSMPPPARDGSTRRRSWRIAGDRVQAAAVCRSVLRVASALALGRRPSAAPPSALSGDGAAGQLRFREGRRLCRGRRRSSSDHDAPDDALRRARGASKSLSKSEFAHHGSLTLDHPSRSTRLRPSCRTGRSRPWRPAPWPRCTIAICASSTSRRRTGPIAAMSSRSILAARSDMLLEEQVAQRLRGALEGIGSLSFRRCAAASGSPPGSSLRQILEGEHQGA